MAFGGYKNFPSREDGSSSSDKFENMEENPFYTLNAKDNNGGHDETLAIEEQEERQWDEIILKMAELNGDESKMEKALRRQPDWVLQKLGLKRDTIQSPRSEGIKDKSKGEGSRPVIPKYSPPHMRKIEQPFVTFDNPLLNGSRRWRDVHRDQSEERKINNQNNRRRNGNGGNDGNWNNNNRGNNINNYRGGNGYDNNQNNGNNRGDNGNHENGNGGNRNNKNGNGCNNQNNDNNNGGGDNGNCLW